MKKVAKEQKIKREKRSAYDDRLRPTHKLKFLIGEKVDSIDYYRKHIGELLPKIQTTQRSYLAGKERFASAVFIEFETMAAAEAAFNKDYHRRPTKFSARQMGVQPDEIIWKNLKMNSKTRMLLHVVATIFISAMILFWSIPVAVVGAISNINYLTENVPFLGFINNIPPVILGVVTGLLPVIVLAVLMALVPVICRCKHFAHDARMHTYIYLHFHYSGSEAFRSSYSLGGRTTVPEMVLRIPGHPTFPDHDIYFWCRRRRQPNRHPTNASR